MARKTSQVDCPRCGGEGEEPGSPMENDGHLALCSGCGGTGSVRPIRLRLTLDITYAVQKGGTTVSELKEIMEDIAEHAASAGLMTRETDAEVNEWKATATARR